MTRSPSLRLLLVVATIGVTMPMARAQSMMDQAIYKRCSAAVQADFQKAGVAPNPAVVSRTCQCVVTQYDATRNVDAAKAICKSQAQSGAN
jgi:hypothetical protein